MSVSGDGAAASLLGPAPLLLLSAPSSTHFPLLLPPQFGQNSEGSTPNRRGGSNKSEMTVQAAESAHTRDTAAQLDDIF